MNIDKYKTFLVASHSKTFFQAAEELSITASTVTKHISSLENEMGVLLFDRFPQGVRLSEEGAVRLPIVMRLVESYQALTNPGSNRIETSQTLRIFSVPAHRNFNLEKILIDFQAANPDIRLEITERHGLSLIKALSEGECEMAFLGPQYLDRGKWQRIVITVDKIGVILPLDHPLATKKSISLTELSDSDFIMMTPESGIFQLYSDYCRKCGFLPRVKTITSRDDSIILYVSAGMGVSLFPQSLMSAYESNNVAFVNLDEEFIIRNSLTKLKNQPLSSLSQVFWDFCNKNYRPLKSGP